MSDATLRTLERDASAAGRRRLVLERARRAPQGHEAMEALRLLAFLGDEEASAATGQALTAMLWGDEAWGGLSVTAADTVRVLQDGWPDAWRLGWRIHLAVAWAILPDWCDGPHPGAGVISVAEARSGVGGSALAPEVESHREGMRASRRCAGVCGETRRRLHMLAEWIWTAERGVAESRLRLATSGWDQTFDADWMGVYALAPPGPVLPVPGPDRQALWPAFGDLLAEGDRANWALNLLAKGDRANWALTTESAGPILRLGTSLASWRRRWALAARKALRRFAQSKLVETVGLEWPGRLA